MNRRINGPSEAGGVYEKYRQLTPENQAVVKEMIAALLTQQKEEHHER